MNVSVKGYHKVIVAIDIYSNYEPVINRALSFVKSPQDITLLYVVMPTIYFEPYALGVGVDIAADLQTKSQQRIEDIAKANNIPEGNAHSIVGNAADEIHNFANENQSDLIIIGTHGQKGVSLLLGSTANAVLHGVKCDVLAIRV